MKLIEQGAPGTTFPRGRVTGFHGKATPVAFNDDFPVTERDRSTKVNSNIIWTGEGSRQRVANVSGLNTWAKLGRGRLPRLNRAVTGVKFNYFVIKRQNSISDYPSENAITRALQVLIRESGFNELSE